MRTACTAVVVATCLGFTAVPCAWSHDWYVQAVDYSLPGPGETIVFQGWGHKVPLDDAIAGDKIGKLQLVSPTGTAETLPVTPERSFHAAPVKLGADGVYTVLGESTPGFYQIYADKTGAVHHAAKPLDELDNVARSMLSVLAFQYPKTYLVVGDQSKAAPPKASGARAEITLEKAPGAMVAGDRIGINILFDGKPALEGTTFDATYMGYSTRMEDYLFSGRPVVDGRGYLDIPTAGVWYLRTHITTPAPAEMQSKCRQILYTATLTFVVAPRPPAADARDS
jgi:hypothetical protein